MRARIAVAFLLLSSQSSVAFAQQTRIWLESLGAQKVSRVYANRSPLSDDDPLTRTIFTAVTPDKTRNVRITVEQTASSSPDSYEIAISIEGTGSIELSIPTITPLPCTKQTERNLSYTQHTPNTALVAVLQARYLLRGVCGTAMQPPIRAILRNRMHDLSVELGHSVNVSL